jgi:UDP-N-acetylglucosamine 2-epimerase (non-hydrolysing)/GDP/UDP-N,N'-diacetylbacillosamine 2-epimerase (hydrolysing)
VNIGTRQKGRESGSNIINVGYNKTEIIKAIKKQLENGSYQPDMLYGDGNSCKKIVDVLKNFVFNIQKQITY